MKTVIERWGMLHPEQGRVADPKTFGVFREVPKFPHSDTFVGVELELEGVNWKDSFLDLFNHHEERSLRKGLELVTKFGVTAGEAMFAIKSLHAEIGKKKLGFRCGLHAHIDVTQFTMEDIYKAVLVYTVLEPLLFDISGNRNAPPTPNRFCVAVLDSVSCFSKIIYYGHRKEWDEVAKVVKSGTKYMAMNVLPITKFGTVEFRHHFGTHDPDVIQPWLQTLLDVVVGSRAMNTENLESQIIGVNSLSYYEELLVDCLPNSHHRISRTDLDKKMYQGVTYFKESILGGAK
jgi:hypothetical protein